MCGTIFRNGTVFKSGMSASVLTKSGAKFLHWGILKGNYEPYNARSERLNEIWKDIASNRCILEADAFVEGHRTFGIRRSKIELGGIYDNTGFALITIPSSEIVLPFHPRMPLIVNGDIDYFLNVQTLDVSKYIHPTLNLFF